MTTCVACNCPIFELDGEFTNLDSFYLEGDDPLALTAGMWHLVCLAASPVAEAWYERRLTNFRVVRKFETVLELADWTVVRDSSQGKRYGFGRSGQLLDLSIGSAVAPLDVAGGKLFAREQDPFFLHLDDAAALATIQQNLATTGRQGLLPIFELMGIVDRILHPEAVAASALVSDAALREDWGPSGARLEYGLYIPDALVPHVGPFVR